MKILVVGTVGIIGFHTAKGLLDRGDAVVVFDVVNDDCVPSREDARFAILEETAVSGALRKRISLKRASPA